MKPVALVLAALLSLAACGSGSTADSSSSRELDRSDAEDVAVAMLTALLKSDIDTLRILVPPDLQDIIPSLEQAAELSRSTEIEIVSITATLIEEDGTTAIVEYSGRYCLPATTTEVPVTAVGQDREVAETISGRSQVVTEPERCFDLDESLRTDQVECELIDGEWYARLPE
jgi:hypothetical protein